MKKINLNKKIEHPEWYKRMMDELLHSMEGYEITDEVWSRHVSMWISEAFGEFYIDLRTKIIKDLKKHHKKKKTT